MPVGDTWPCTAGPAWGRLTARGEAEGLSWGDSFTFWTSPPPRDGGLPFPKKLPGAPLSGTALEFFKILFVDNERTMSGLTKRLDGVCGEEAGKTTRRAGLAPWDLCTPRCPEPSWSLRRPPTWVALVPGHSSAPSLDRQALVLGEFSSWRPRRCPRRLRETGWRLRSFQPRPVRRRGALTVQSEASGKYLPF